MELTNDPGRDGALQLASLFGALVAWVRKSRIQMAAQALIVQRHLNISEEEWKPALVEAESSLPADLKDPLDFDAIRTFLRKI